MLETSEIVKWQKGFNLDKLPAHCRDDIETKPHSHSNLHLFICGTCGRMPKYLKIKCHFGMFTYDAIYFIDTDSYSTGWETTLASLLLSSYFLTKLARLCMKNIPNMIFSVSKSTLLCLFLESKSLPLALEGRITFFKVSFGTKKIILPLGCFSLLMLGFWLVRRRQDETDVVFECIFKEAALFLQSAKRS